jgi:hypothetical protein
VQNATSNRWSLVPDGIGILSIGAQLYLLFRLVVPDDGFQVIWGNMAFVVLVFVALYFWHKEPPMKYFSEPSGWVAAIFVTVLLGALSFGIDMIIGLIKNSKISPIEAGTKVGSPFGFPLTVMLCPGCTMIATAGLLRALLFKPSAAFSVQR